VQGAAGPGQFRRERGDALLEGTGPGLDQAYLVADAGIRQFLDIGSGIPTERNVHQAAYSRRVAARSAIRTRAEITGFFDGFGLLGPGIVWLPEWRPHSPGDVPEDPARFWGLAGVGTLP
jgi:hypothetical protein